MNKISRNSHTIYQLLVLVPLCLGLSSCGGGYPSCDDVVCKSYVHPYGLEMSSREWCDQGSCGEVITKHKDGRVVSEQYNQGALEGEVSKTFPHKDTVETVEVYEQGQLRKEQHHYPSGMRKQEIEYISDTEYTEREFYEHGTPKSVERYSQGRLVEGDYYNLSQAIESSVKDYYGKRTRRDLYGQLQAIDTIKDGFLVSTMTYHSNGMPEAETSYQDGLIHGTRHTYLPGGEPHTIEEWDSGFQSGITMIFENGEKISEIQYDRGEKHGKERRFRDETVVVEEISWQNGQRHGPTFRYVDGTVITDWYFQGRPVSKAVYDKRTAFLRQ